MKDKKSRKKSRKTAIKPKEASDLEKRKIIELMHEYNDLKDATQLVLGALATLKSIPIGSVYATYNLPRDE
ncbi:DNA repair protein SWI5 homolog [Drosophila biarmipes]|uniref:DNA repair protein SWI5 homolog n=1 Tax=Drosophila biarmipes TaxID=125945 RepID=UPI0007E77A8E|nr:DNA repair protein SWI5 homolog [Drosophila biarmipes]